MKKIKILLIIAILLPLQALACLDSSTQDVDNYLGERLAALRYGPDVIPELLILKNNVEVSFTKRGMDKNIALEFFIKASPGAYRLVPGLGLTLKASDESLFYICVNLKGTSSSNFVRIVHLERQGIFSKRFNTEPVPLYLTPVTEGTLLLGGFLQTLGVADQKKLNATKAPIAVQNTLNKLFQGFFKLGVEQIDVRPKEVEITTVSKILGRFESSRKRQILKMDSSWLVSR